MASRPVLAATVLAAAASALLPPAACMLPNRSPAADVALGFPRIANRMRSTGAVNFSVIFVDFSDAPSPDAPSAIFARLQPAAQLYSNLSRGALTPVFSPLLTTLRMSRPSTAYDIRTEDGQRAYLVEASTLAIAAGWDFSRSDSIVAMASAAARALPNGPAFCATPGGGFVASGRTFENAATSGFDFAHW